MQSTQEQRSCSFHKLPALHKLSNVFECFSIESFGKVVSPLFFRIDLFNVDLTTLHMAPEEMPLDQEVLGSVCNALFGCEQKGAVVVFEDTATNGRLEYRWKEEDRHQFDEHVTEWNERSHGCAERRVFRFKGRKGDLGLQLRLPENWAAAKGDDVSGSRLGA